MSILRIAGWATLAIVVALLVYLAWPLRPQLAPHPQPAQSYAEALARVEAGQVDIDLHPLCTPLLLTHGQQVTQTIVFFHGITNCPNQFRPMGEAFYAMGYNVLVPRLPHHGLADRMTTDLEQLTAEELVASADEAVDIAAGLGEEITVAGFSMGGNMAAWVAENRPEVDRVVLLSPFLSPKGYPPWVMPAITRALLLLPNQFWWWNPKLEEAILGPIYGYPRYSTHALAQVIRLGYAVRHPARATPVVTSLLVVTNTGPDEPLDNAVTGRLVAAWRSYPDVTLTTLELPASLNLEHDYIDPNQRGQPVDVVEVVYPQLLAAIQQME